MSTGSRKTTTSDSLVKTKNELIGPGICERREGLDVVDPEKATISLSPRSACGTAPNTVVEEISTAQDWNGPGDFDNPQNWSMNKRIYHTILPGLFGFAVTFATSVYTLGSPDAMKQFHVGTTVALLPLASYTVGLTFGPVLAAPLSETHGRKAVYLISIPIFALFILGSGLANNFATLAICRFLAGVFGSPPLAVGAGSISDLWSPEHYAAAATLFITCTFLGPAFGPVVGGFVAEHKGWRWTQGCILFVTVTFYLFVIVSSETYKKTILQRRAKRLDIAPPASDAPTGPAALNHMLLTEPIIAALSFYVAFNFAVLFAFFAHFPWSS